VVGRGGGPLACGDDKCPWGFNVKPLFGPPMSVMGREGGGGGSEMHGGVWVGT
jgi:hypothetical protein